MNPIVRNILSVITGCVIGGIVNGAIISISSYIIPPPAGADVTTMEGLKASIHLFEPKHFIMPFLAHALGTLVGAIIAALIAASNKMRLALIVGVVFFAGGLSMVIQLPGPMWFNILDLAAAYIPMAFIGGYFASKK